MFRIRLHGRGGQGMKTASRILGTALFREGFEVQDAPRYGAERRGAPVFAYVRASRQPIHERGEIVSPDLVVVADDTLVPAAAAGVLQGLDARTVLLICSDQPAEVWRERLELEGPVLVLAATDASGAELHFVGATCAGAAARLLHTIPREVLERAIREELGEMKPAVVDQNLERALAAFDAEAAHEGCVVEGPDVAASGTAPEWVDLPFETARVSAPDIHGSLTSLEVRTGLWRTVRPVIDYDHCNRCSWLCSTFCPDGAISVDADRTPRIDYDHCKGCMVCAAVCPTHAIRSEPERGQAEPELAPPKEAQS